MTLEEYEELYCTYCDSQRCVHTIGTTVDEICPYWKERMELEGEKNGHSN